MAATARTEARPSRRRDAWRGAARDAWRRSSRDPYVLLLLAAAAIQVMLASSHDVTNRPGWEIAAGAVFAAACACAVLARMRHDRSLSIATAYLLLVATACWRATEREPVNGLGALALVAVIWLALYGRPAHVAVAICAVAAAMIVPPFVLGTGIVGADWARVGLSIAAAAFVGPTISSLVTQRRREAARASALEPAGSQLDAVMRAANGHLIIGCEPDGTVTAFNPGAERILGWRADEVVGRMSLLDFHDPGETPALAERLQVEPRVDRLLETNLLGEPHVRDYACRTKDGRRIVVALSISGIHDTDGRLTGYVGIGTDVTQARAAMQSLASQREIYRLLVDHLPGTTVALWDEKLRCVTIGGHWISKSGAVGGQYVGKPIDEFFHEDDRAQGRALFEHARAGAVEQQMDLADGKTYEFAALPVHGPDGQALVLSLARDVTERRHAERERQQMIGALAVSEASFREAFEGAPIGIALTTADADERFLRVNPAFAAILGSTPEELVGRVVAEVTHPEDAHLVPDLTGQTTTKLRKRFMRPSGRPVWVDVSYAIVRDADGAPSHIIKQIQDVNTIKESERALLDALEQQRAATASLRELDKIRTDLVGTISHELRTPLTSVHGYLELLDSEPLTDTQHGMLDVALRNSERLSNLVDNLLVLVRLDSAESLGTFNTDDVSMTDAVRAALDTVRPELLERQQELSAELPSFPLVVHGDAEQLDRVLVNLLSNASKYTPRGGRVSVTMRADDTQLSIEVADNGIGIPRDEQDQLFGRFFRASTARANAISGNGLGLAIVKSIVERHDGTVEVDSATGAGSRFTVTLPLAVKPAVVGSPAR